MADWYWDDTVKRYRTASGKFLSAKQAQSYVDRSIAASQNIAATLAELVANNQMSPSAFEKAMRENLKREYIRQYLLGHGGINTMRFSDWGRIGAMLKEQYRYLSGFVNEIAQGLLTEGQIRARAAMYLNSASEGFEKAQELQATAWGAVSESWHTTPGAEHCPDCIAYEAEGIQPLGTFPLPGAGATICLCILSPEVPVLTMDGWKSMMDVEVGELVLTHRMRWRPVTGIVVKSALPTHRVAFINGIACTDNHLWYTNAGWVSAYDIHNSLVSCYTLPKGDNNYGKENLQELWYEVAPLCQGRVMHGLQKGMSLRSYERSQVIRVQDMRRQKVEQARQGTMAEVWRKDGQERSRSWQEAQDAIRGNWQPDLADKEGRPQVELVLGRGQEANNISLSVDMDNGKWANSKGICYPSYQSQLIRRQIRKSGIDAVSQTCETTRKNSTGEQFYAGLELPILRKEIQELQTKRERPEILLGEMPPQGTAIFDLTVEEDHSFCIGGLFAHNTNCQCEKHYYNESGEEYYA